MKTASFLLWLILPFLALALAGCDAETPPVASKVDGAPITAPIATKEEIISTAAGEIRLFNADNPNPPSRAGIDSGVSRIETAIATAPAGVSIAQIRAIVEDHNRLADGYNALVRDLEKAKAEGEQKMRALVVKGLLALGSLFIMGGVCAALWTSYKFGGAALIGVGLAIAAAGPVITKPWVVWLFFSAAILSGFAFGIRFAWGWIDKNGNGRPDFLERPRVPPVAPATSPSLAAASPQG